MKNFNNPEYDFEQLMELIAKESPTFASILEGLVKDTDDEYPTNETWLGTLKKDGKPLQVKLAITQEQRNFIDEN